MLYDIAEPIFEGRHNIKCLRFNWWI